MSDTNREQRRKMSKKASGMSNPNTAATQAAQTLLDSSAILVQGINKGRQPTNLEVYGLASMILRDVYEELLKEMVSKNEQANEEVTSTEE